MPTLKTSRVDGVVATANLAPEEVPCWPVCGLVGMEISARSWTLVRQFPMSRRGYWLEEGSAVGRLECSWKMGTQLEDGNAVGEVLSRQYFPLNIRYDWPKGVRGTA